MKHGRIIALKSDSLIRVRTDLRRLWLTALDDQFNRSLDKGYLQNSLDNYIGVQKIERNLRSMDDLFQFSICRCWRCRSIERDAVFWNGAIEDQFAYPPYGEDEEIDHTDTYYYWVCPECYKAQMERIERHKKEKYYYFREYDIRATLRDLGIEKPEDIHKYIEEENKFFNDFDDTYYEKDGQLYKKAP